MLDTATLLPKLQYILGQPLFPSGYRFIEVCLRPARIAIRLPTKAEVNAGKYVSVVKNREQKVILILAPSDRSDVLPE